MQNINNKSLKIKKLKINIDFKQITLLIFFICNSISIFSQAIDKNDVKKNISKKTPPVKKNTKKSIKTTESKRQNNVIVKEKIIEIEKTNDKDGDGIIDKIDKCPNIYGLLKYEGCPDTDGDGIIDLYDKCPNEKGDKDNFGCKIISSKEEIESNSIGKVMPLDVSNLEKIEKVIIPGVAWKMSKYEITIGEYLAFCKKVNNHWPEWLEKDNIYNIYTGSNPIYKDKGISELMFDRPIMGISWEDAVAFCNYIGGRLPTADEWEYAAKINENKIYAGSDKIDEVAWYYENSRLIPESVGQKKPTVNGLYDMTGNVWEWTNSIVGNERLTKGGSVVNISSNCLISNWESRHYKHRRFDLGFRVLFP